MVFCGHQKSLRFTRYHAKIAHPTGKRLGQSHFHATTPATPTSRPKPKIVRMTGEEAAIRSWQDHHESPVIDILGGTAFSATTFQVKERDSC